MLLIQLRDGSQFTLDAEISGVSKEKGTVTNAEGRVIAMFTQSEMVAVIDKAVMPKSPQRRPLAREIQQQADIGDR